VSRKAMFVAVLVVLVAVVIPLAACGPAPTPQVVEKIVEKQVVQTQVVEKVVEKQVVQTQVVEKQVQVQITATPLPKPKGVGELNASYQMDEGTILLTPQPDLIAQFKLKPEYKSTKALNIAYITKHLVNAYFVATDRGVQKRCKEMGVNCTTFAPEKPDNPEEQIRMVEDAVNKKVDGIVIYTVDSKVVSPALKKAEAAGIPVVGLGTVAFGTKMVTFISADYYTRSYDIAKLLADKLGGKGNFVTIDGVPGAQNAKDMKAGYLDALRQYQGIQVLASQTGYWKRLEGQAAMENLLQRYPQLDGVVGADDESALGAIQALQAAGVDLKKTLVVGFNASHDGICAIQDGKMFATDDADPGGLAAAGVEVLVRSIQDKEKFPPEIPWPLPNKKFYVTPDNLMQYWPVAYGLSDEEKASGKCKK
jgi:ABC-type sugar transport system substrate-binding protein